MRVVVQRVKRAAVRVGGESVGEIGTGLLLLVAARRGDTTREADWIASKIANLRIFGDEAGKMNRSLLDVQGSALVVSQFTLYGDCSHGRRPGYSDAADPAEAAPLVERVARQIEEAGIPVGRGVFGAHMDVDLLNDGPVTLIVDRDAAAAPPPS